MKELLSRYKEQCIEIGKLRAKLNATQITKLFPEIFNPTNKRKSQAKQVERTQRS